MIINCAVGSDRMLGLNAPGCSNSQGEHNVILNSIIQRKADGNPEGKGTNALLLDWYRSEPRGVVAKPGRQVLAEFFTSMLALSATFKYRPVPGRANYLYWVNNEWSLSLIAPDEWSDERQASFVGTCILQRDMTWTIDPSGLVGLDNPITDALQRFYDGFAKMLHTDLTLEEILPSYVGRLPYYQRIYASGLGRSLRASVSLGDQSDVPCRLWLQQLPQENHLLLAGTGS